MKPEAFFLYNQACEKEEKQQIASQCSMPQSSELSTDVHQKKISEIIPGKLYLGNYSASQDKGLLQRYGITNIVNITVTGACSFPEDFRYLNIKMADSQGGIEPHLKKVVDFIEQGKTVFVHCRYGVSRSSSLVIAYLMYKNQWPYEQSYDFVKEKRKWICPHALFVEELRAYQKELGIVDRNEPKISNR